jgi:hypothetical protein
VNQTDPDPVLDDNRHALLEEGARSYLEALTAITIFRNEVRATCRQVIESQLTEFLQALGVPTDQAEPIVPDETPEDQFNGSSAYLAVKHKISRRRTSAHGFGCISSCGLSWEPVGQQRWFGCYVSVWFNHRELAEQLHAAFQQRDKRLPSGVTLGTQKNNVWLSRALEPADMASLSKHLGEVMGQWIRLWKEFGGLKALVSEEA